MKKYWPLFGTAGLFTADQLLKSYAEQNLDKAEERTVAGPVVLRRVENEGMCLGLLSDRPKAVRALSLAASAAVTVMQAAAFAGRKALWKKMALSLLSAGAWSNTFDRFARGYVVDYIGFSRKDAKCSKLSKLTYNMGDFLIAAGALMLSVYSLFVPTGRKKENAKVEES